MSCVSSSVKRRLGEHWRTVPPCRLLTQEYPPERETPHGKIYCTEHCLLVPEFQCILLKELAVAVNHPKLH